MKVLVTGATGFVGKEIVSELQANKLEVIQTARQNIGSLSIFFAADISKVESLSEIEKIGKIDAVIHSAGLAHQFGKIEKAKFDAVNVFGTKNIVQTAVKLQAKQFILIGSTAVYGIKSSENTAGNKSEFKIDENAECHPQTLYAESKLEAERIAIKKCQENNIALTILRLAPVLGEGNVGNAARLVRSIDRNRFIWVGKGENLKSLIYKQDIGRACAKILINKKGRTEIFNLAAEPVKMHEFVNEIARELGKKIPQFSISPEYLKFIFRFNAKFFGFDKIKKISETVEKWLSDDVYSGQKIKSVYNFHPKVSIIEAVERQVNHYIAEKRSGFEQK